MPSLSLGDNIPHLLKESFGDLFAWGIRALDTHKQGRAQDLRDGYSKFQVVQKKIDSSVLVAQNFHKI